MIFISKKCFLIQKEKYLSQQFKIYLMRNTLKVFVMYELNILLRKKT